MVLLDLQSHMLLHCIVHFIAFDLDILEVSLDIDMRCLVLVEELPLKLCLHVNLSLTAAAASDHILTLLLIGDSSLGKECIVPDLELFPKLWRIIKVSILQLDLHSVLDLGLWLLPNLVILELQRGWKRAWQHKLELNGVVANVEHLVVGAQVKEICLELKAFVFVFDSLMVLHLT